MFREVLFSAVLYFLQKTGTGFFLVIESTIEFSSALFAIIDELFPVFPYNAHRLAIISTSQ